MSDWIPNPTRPAVGHIPFPGHRTMATVWAQQSAARRREAMKQREAEEYGFEPESLKVAK